MKNFLMGKYEKIKNRNLDLNSRKFIAGYIFSMPFIIGFIFFFLYPFVQTIIFSFNEMQLGRTGFDLDFVGILNYRHAIYVDPRYVRYLVETIGSMLSNLPFILAFSFFSALILNQKFKGRMLARVIFFLPVIMAAGVIERMEAADIITQLMAQEGAVFGFSGQNLANMLRSVHLPEILTDFILDAVDAIPTIIRNSGVQILIFLAGLQSIPSSVYEAADVEGASSWESFWLITLPMLSPLILTNIIYTVIDSFVAADNELVILIRDATSSDGYGIGMAMSVIYFLVIIVILVLIYKIVSRWVFFQE